MPDSPFPISVTVTSAGPALIANKARDSWSSLKLASRFHYPSFDKAVRPRELMGPASGHKAREKGQSQSSPRNHISLHSRHEKTSQMLCLSLAGLGSREMDASLVPGHGHSEGPNTDTKSYRATSQPPRLMLPLIARS